MSREMFQVMRLQILSAALNPATAKHVDDAYALAWSESVYPSFSNGVTCHKDFASYFDVSDRMVTDLGSHMDKQWLDLKNKRLVKVDSFYDIERTSSSLFPGQKWGRSELIYACHYMKLNRMFDDEYWALFMCPGGFPTEASRIVEPFHRQTSIYLIN